MPLSLKKFTYFLYLSLFFPVLAFAFDGFDCLGTEPNWKLSMTENKFTFQQNAMQSISMPAVNPEPAENMDMDHIRVFRTKANNSNVIIIIQKQSCSGGASEEVFLYEGLFITTDKVFHGCCSKKILLTH